MFVAKMCSTYMEYYHSEVIKLLIMEQYAASLSELANAGSSLPE